VWRVMGSCLEGCDGSGEVAFSGFNGWGETEDAMTEDGSVVCSL